MLTLIEIINCNTQCTIEKLHFVFLPPHNKTNIMRFATITLLVVFATLTCMAQPRPNRGCRNPMPESSFKQSLKTVTMQKSERLKLEKAKMVALDNCLSSEQVKTIAEVFIHDYSRLEFSETAWENTTDKENFYYVYDAFANISTVFKLHDWIRENDHPEHPFDPLPPIEPITPNFAALDYPNPYNYKGPSNCGNPLEEREFLEIARRYSVNTHEQERTAIFTQVVQENCMTVAQVMKLASLLQIENNRLTLFRASWSNIYDLGQLSFGRQLFSQPQSKDAFEHFLQNGRPFEAIPCKINPEQYRDMLESIRTETFNSTKITITKNIIQSNPCFYSRQIQEIVGLFSFDSGKLEIAKFAYDYTIDKENYYKVADAFSFSNSKEELIDYIRKRR